MPDLRCETQPADPKWLNRLHREGVAMRVTFTCQTCNSPVEYEFAGTETHRLRRYGVRHYVRANECPGCAAPQESSVPFAFETPAEWRHPSGLELQVSEALAI
jgi:hypothetical protein